MGMLHQIDSSLMKEQKKALEKNRKAIASIRILFVAMYSVDAMTKLTVDKSIPTTVNSFPIMAPILAPLLGVLFLRGRIFLKNRT
jgi:hypothetical protein